MKKNKQIEEKRQTPRFRILSIVKYTLEDSEGPLQVANIRDLSKGGLTFIAEHEIPEGEVLRFCFLPPQHKAPVNVKGRIVRCRAIRKKPKGFEIGVKFLDVPEEARLAIEGLEAFYLAKRSTP